MNNKVIIGALSQDLYRVAMGLHKGSFQMAKRFCEEALKRQEEVDIQTVKPYIKKLLVTLPEILRQEDNKKRAEDALMYSVIFKNYTQVI